MFTLISGVFSTKKTPKTSVSDHFCLHVWGVGSFSNVQNIN